MRAIDQCVDRSLAVGAKAAMPVCASKGSTPCGAFNKLTFALFDSVDRAGRPPRGQCRCRSSSLSVAPSTPLPDRLFFPARRFHRKPARGTVRLERAAILEGTAIASG